MEDQEEVRVSTSSTDTTDFSKDKRDFWGSHSENSFLDEIGLAARTSPVVHTATSTASRSSRQSDSSSEQKERPTIAQQAQVDSMVVMQQTLQ